MMELYQPGDTVVWDRGSYYGANRASEHATIVCDFGKTRVKILCQDGEERWVYRHNVRRLVRQAWRGSGGG